MPSASQGPKAIRGSVRRRVVTRAKSKPPTAATIMTKGSACHNTVHEDWAMLLRYDVLTDPNNAKNSKTHVTVIPTPNPSPNGVEYVTPEILPEGNPFARGFRAFPRRSA